MTFPNLTINPNSGGPKPVTTRFRAYQLGEPGSSFSYFAGGKITLIEARITDQNWPSIKNELMWCGRPTIDVLHVTSWDADHCNETGLRFILEHLQPSTVEYPGYSPHTESAHTCLCLINEYVTKRTRLGKSITARRIDPAYIFSLQTATGLAYEDIFYHPRQLYVGSNDNSTVKLFRTGSFNVASLGDIENANIGAMLRRCTIFCREVDVLILAHHGAAGGITTRKFLEEVRPSLAICTSNYDNQYEHPCEEVQDLLFEHGIPIYTTKTGDVVIASLEPHTTRFRVTNLQSDCLKISSVRDFSAKKVPILSRNADSIRNLYRPGFKGLVKPR